MSYNIRFPNITGKTEAEQLIQVKSYLHQLVEQLNWALSTIEAGGSSTAANAADTQTRTGAGTSYEDAVSFYELKSLIIKSADTVNAYYEEIEKRLESQYVAKSDFGTYVEEASQDIQANATAIENFYTNMQAIITDIDNLEHSLIEVNANIKTGLLYYADDGTPVYGLEIGQRTEIEGVEVFNKFARFTADRLSFYDQNDTEVAYISDKKLYITHVEVTGSYRIGGFIDTVLSDGSVVTKWIETGGDG